METRPLDQETTGECPTCGARELRGVCVSGCPQEGDDAEMGKAIEVHGEATQATQDGQADAPLLDWNEPVPPGVHQWRRRVPPVAEPPRPYPAGLTVVTDDNAARVQARIDRG